MNKNNINSLEALRLKTYILVQCIIYPLKGPNKNLIHLHIQNEGLNTVTINNGINRRLACYYKTHNISIKSLPALTMRWLKKDLAIFFQIKVLSKLYAC